MCMNSRAVHLEVAKSLETDDFILVLMRFLNRRGHVKELRSDNGTNFVGVDREIKEALVRIDNDKITGICPNESSIMIRVMILLTNRTIQKS